MEDDAESLILCIDMDSLERSYGSGEFPLLFISLNFSIAVSQPSPSAHLKSGSSL
jgi:hypothetical protein